MRAGQGRSVRLVPRAANGPRLPMILSDSVGSSLIRKHGKISNTAAHRVRGGCNPEDRSR